MNWKDIKVLYIRELRSALRDRTIVTNSILLPIFLYPVMMWLMYTGFMFVSGQNDELKSRIVLRNVPAAHDTLKKQLESDESIIVSTSADPASEIKAGTVDALAEFLPSEEPPIRDNFATRLTFDESRDRSATAKMRVEQKISRYRDDYLARQAADLGIPPERFQNFWVESENVSTNRQMGQFILGMLLPIFLMIMLAVGAMHPAIDSTAGEREHSTWETGMTFATPRINVMVAKYLYVSTMSFTAGFLNLMAMIFSMGAILAPLFRGRSMDLSFVIPWSSAPVILLGAALMALTVAAGMMILASFARTFKEGQSLVSPFYIALLLPVMFLQTPGMEFTPMMAMVPVMNVTMMFREAIQGIYKWDLIAVTIGVELLCVVAALKLASAILKYEDFIMGNFAGSLTKFARQRLLRKV